VCGFEDGARGGGDCFGLIGGFLPSWLGIWMVLLSVVQWSGIALCLSVIRVMLSCYYRCLSVSTMSELLTIFNWNVRDLNSPARREAVHDMVQSTQPKLVCLQETKLTQIT
jgi:hypothetical protein